MDLVAAAYKVGKVIRSAQTLEQHKSAARVGNLWREHLKRHSDKHLPLKDVLIAAIISLFALIGVIATMAFVSQKLID